VRLRAAIEAGRCSRCSGSYKSPSERDRNWTGRIRLKSDSALVAKAISFMENLVEEGRAADWTLVADTKTKKAHFLSDAMAGPILPAALLPDFSSVDSIMDALLTSQERDWKAPITFTYDPVEGEEEEEEEEEEEAAEAGRDEPAADELEAAIGELGDSSDLRDAIAAPDE